MRGKESCLFKHTHVQGSSPVGQEGEGEGERDKR